MRSWLVAASAALRHVADRPALWIPGALAWVSSVGWLPFIFAVLRPPTQSELTYFGAGLQTSGLWPLNLVLLAAGVVLVVVAATALVAIANATLWAAIHRRSAHLHDAARLFVASLAGVLPVALVVFVLLVATMSVAPTEFTRPVTQTGPVVRTILRLAPLIGVGAILAVASAALASLIGRAAMATGSLGHAVVALPSLARRAGVGAIIHVLAITALNLAFLAFGAILLRVLWAPIGAVLLAGVGLDAGTALLLVGFVAIWLCLVLIGGALHAWGSVTWAHLLGAPVRERWPGRSQERAIER